MFYLCIIVHFVHLVIFVNTLTTEAPRACNVITTKLILINGTNYKCPHTDTIHLTENDTVSVEMTHWRFINQVLVTIPSRNEFVLKDSSQNSYKKYYNFTVSPTHTGKWIFNTLTGKDASIVSSESHEKYPKGTNITYYSYKCEFNVKVSKLSVSDKFSDNLILYILIGVAVLALIIVIQTGVICYILKAKKTRRIENMALINKPRASDTVRYSTTPSRKLSLKAPSTEEIYETLDIVQGTDAPPPPPIDTLPKERIKRRSPMPLPDENDGAQNQPVNKNETEPLTRTESNFSVHMRSGKVKIPAFCAPSSAATVAPEKVAKSIRKPSTINQDAISNELNNILKRRADTMAGPNQKTPVATPKQIPETKPKKGIFQALKPPPLHKPTIPVTPAKPHSVLPRPRPTQKPNSPSDKTPNCVKPPTQPLPPLPTQSPRPTPAMSEHVDSPQRPVFKPAPIPLEDDPEYMEGPEYADYNENYDDDSADEWTYEPLDPPSKYDYNIYST